MHPIRVRHYLIVSTIIGLLLVSFSIFSSNAWSEQEIERKVASRLTVSSPAASLARMPKMSVRHTFETASLYIQLKEVLQVSGTVGKLTPEARVNLVRERLSHFLQEGGNPRDIKPGQEGNDIVVRAGEDVLITVDSETAGKTQLNQKQLAFMWANMIRESLGADSLSRDPNLIASRGFSPVLPQQRELNERLSAPVKTLQGNASWYGPGFHGRRTANGERFDMNSLTAAHRTLPFNTKVKVTNKRTGQSTLVRITDRGPYAHGRIIDLSKGAAAAIGMISSGTAPVTVEVLGR